MYWSTNNVISLAQTAVLKSKGVKSFLNIPEAPAPQNTPNLKIRDPMTALTEVQLTHYPVTNQAILHEV